MRGGHHGNSHQYSRCSGPYSTALPATAATLLGANVTEEYRHPNLSTPYAQVTYTTQTFVVGAGQESIIDLEGVTTFGVDFSASSLDLAFDTTLTNPTFENTDFNGLVFTSDAFSQFTGVTVRGITNLSGFDASRVSLVGNELRLNWGGLSYDTNTVVGLDFSSAVPEPASWALMLVGFGIVGASMRARGKRAIRAAYS